MEKQIKEKKKKVEKNQKGIYHIRIDFGLKNFFWLAFLKIKEQLNKSIIF